MDMLNVQPWCNMSSEHKVEARATEGKDDLNCDRFDVHGVGGGTNVIGRAIIGWQQAICKARHRRCGMPWTNPSVG